MERIVSRQYSKLQWHYLVQSSSGFFLEGKRIVTENHAACVSSIHGRVVCVGEMQRERFVVKYITANSCFAHLSAIWLRRLESEVSFRSLRNVAISFDVKTCVTWPTGCSSALWLRDVYSRAAKQMVMRFKAPSMSEMADSIVNYDKLDRYKCELQKAILFEKTDVLLSYISYLQLSNIKL